MGDKRDGGDGIVLFLELREDDTLGDTTRYTDGRESEADDLTCTRDEDDITRCALVLGEDVCADDLACLRSHGSYL